MVARGARGADRGGGGDRRGCGAADVTRLNGRRRRRDRRRRAAGGGSAVLRLRRVRAHRHPRRGGPRPGPRHPARHTPRARRRPSRSTCRGRRGRCWCAGRRPLAGAAAPLSDAVPRPAGTNVPVVRVGAAVAALGSLLALILGVGGPPWPWPAAVTCRARWRPCTRVTGASPCRAGGRRRGRRAGGPGRPRSAIGFSTFRRPCLLRHRQRLRLTLGRDRRVLAALGLVGCLVLAVSLPPVSVLVGFGVLALGALWYALRHR